MLSGQLNQRGTTHVLMFSVSKFRRKRLIDNFGAAGKIVWIVELYGKKIRTGFKCSDRIQLAGAGEHLYSRSMNVFSYVTSLGQYSEG